MISKMFRVYMAVLVVASAIQALALGYMWGFEEGVASEQDRLKELGTRLYWLDYYYGDYFGPRGIHNSLLPSIILSILWFIAFDKWRNERNQQAK